MSSNQQFVYRRLSKATNIRIVWLEPGNEDGSISLWMLESMRPIADSAYRGRGGTTEYFASSAEYTAVSYTWGDPNDTLPILVNGKAFRVTRNLHDFLQEMRMPPVQQGPYWIDALCINQEDGVEKSRQVSMMGEIYKCSYHTIVWLGKADDDSGLGFQLMSYVFEVVSRVYHDLNSLSPNEFPLDDTEVWTKAVSSSKAYHEALTEVPIWGSESSQKGEICSDEAWIALMKVLSRQWFHRMWTLQEFLEAPTVAITFGCYSLRSLELGVLWEMIRIHRRSYGDPPGWAISRLYASHYLNDERKLYKIEATRRNLLTNTIHYRTRLSSDPRDKIFALVGFSLEEGFIVDYSQTVQQLYHSFAVRQLQNGHLTEVLSSIRGHGTVLGLPSWVPDWTTDDYSEGTEVAYEPHTGAGGSTVAAALFSDDGMSLYKGGVLLDTVRSTHILEDRIPSAPLDTYTLRIKKYLAEESLDSTQFIPSCQTTDDIFARLLAGDTLEIDGTFISISSERSIIEQFFEHEETEKSYSGIGKGHLLITTESGYMGLGPLSSKRGDVVAVLVGLPFPFLLQHHDDHHRIRGSCYIHGVMDEEIMKEVEAGKRFVQELEIR